MNKNFYVINLETNQEVEHPSINDLPEQMKGYSQKDYFFALINMAH